MRITKKNLNNRVRYLNEITDNPTDISSRYTPEPQRHSNIGHYCLDWAYGGVQLAQITNEGLGQRNVLNTGFTTKKNCYNAVNAYISGIESNK